MTEEEVPVRTPADTKAGLRKFESDTKKVAAAEEKKAVAGSAARVAQVVNLTIAGYSYDDIGRSIGATADEVEQMLTRDAARYVRTQPALRTYVRQFISGKYTKLLDAVWDEATDKKHPEKLENQDRALRILDKMAKLHGAEAPTQTEVKVDAVPENVERMVAALAAAQGAGYDATIFDTVPGEVIHRAAEEADDELARAEREVDAEQEDDEPLA